MKWERQGWRGSKIWTFTCEKEGNQKKGSSVFLPGLEETWTIWRRRERDAEEDEMGRISFSCAEKRWRVKKKQEIGEGARIFLMMRESPSEMKQRDGERKDDWEVVQVTSWGSGPLSFLLHLSLFSVSRTCVLDHIPVKPTSLLSLSLSQFCTFCRFLSLLRPRSFLHCKYCWCIHCSSSDSLSLWEKNLFGKFCNIHVMVCFFSASCFPTDVLKGRNCFQVLSLSPSFFLRKCILIPSFIFLPPDFRSCNFSSLYYHSQDQV